jgi:hypothetical protein
MKRSKKLLFRGGLSVLGLAAVFVVTASAQATPQKTDLAPLPKPVPLPCNGPDLAVTPPNIKAENYNGRWWVVVRAQVANRGTMDFVSKPEQAVILLISKRLWIPGDQTVMKRATITRLNKGAGMDAGGSFQLPDFLKAGCGTPLKPNECCREVQISLKIVYDPDIRKDGNPANDDCNAGNDSWPDTPATRLKYTISCLKMK